MNYDTMLAGREMDALVAEKVMGWKKGDAAGTPVWYTPEPDGAMFARRLCVAWCPSAPDRISDAWEVVEKIRQRQWTVELNGHEWYDGGRWECVLKDALDDERSRASDMKRNGPGGGGWAEPSAPLAICRAALKSVGEKEGE